MTMVKRLGAWRAFIRPALPDGLALLALLLLTPIFWSATLGLGWIPSGGDLVSLLWPNYSYAAQSLHAGCIPLWNPTLRAGWPFAARNQTGLFCPFNLAFLLALPLLWEVMEWLVAGHTWLPAALAPVHLSLTRHSVGWAIGAGVLFGASTLAGMAQMSSILALGLGLCAVWRVAWAGRRRARRSR